MYRPYIEDWTEEEKRTCDLYQHGGIVSCYGCPYANHKGPGTCKLADKYLKKHEKDEG